MIINHNITALNTYRQLNVNSNAQAKSMAKLSSGLRINSAADDAAGLSISEKMKGQIRGLDQASRNAQDGISMVSTAEGALNETQDILQRMRELATQASNGTNTDQDRDAIQKESNQLTSEINRIGNTTEFNTKKLLNGDKQYTANATVSGKTLTGGLSIGNVNGNLNGSPTAGVTAVAAVWNSGAITNIADTESGSVTFNGVTVTLNGATGAPVAASATSSTAASVTVDAGVAPGTLTEDTVDALVSAFTAAKNFNDGNLTDNALAGFTFSKSGTGAAAKLVITGTSADGATNNLNALATSGSTFAIANTSAANQQSAGNGGVAGVTGQKASSDITFTGVPAEGTNITIANKKVAFYDSTSGNFADANAAKTALNADYVVDTNGLATGSSVVDKLVQTINSNPISGVVITKDGVTAAKLDVQTSSEGPFSGTLLSKTDVGTAVAATGKITFDSVPTEGSSIKIGTKSIGFYDSSKGTYADATAAKTALNTDYIIDVNGKNNNQVRDALISLDPQLTEVNLASTGTGEVTVTAAATGTGGNALKLDVPKTSTSGFSATMQIGANSGQTMTINIQDMRSQALAISSTNGGGNVTAKNGQVASYVAVTNVTDGTNDNNTEFSLDLSSTDKATAAISVLDDAINSVSSQRSALGAYQNRLDHTINNLNTSSQNITDAQSRITDVDMAKEMMNQTKSSVLAQAAQAMLAQANQQPQQVLQLLR